MSEAANIHYPLVIDHVPTLSELSHALYRKVAVIKPGTSATVDLVINGRLISQVFNGSNWSNRMIQSYISKWGACELGAHPDPNQVPVTLHPEKSITWPPEVAPAANTDATGDAPAKTRNSKVPPTV
jgi:hypothetical protein